jgi:beta-glucosidase/6-phospho-beta-glucosidase/beta-galactosidase
MEFILATGIECSAPTINGGIRRDQIVLSGHRDRFGEDFAAVRALRLRYLRYGVPFHVVARDADRHDWEWTDRALRGLRDAGIEPIVDLLHFGVPDRLSGFGDPRLPSVFLEYVRRFADRYPWVRWYTPVNEPFITALFSARFGWWNEAGTRDRTFVQALDNTVACAIGGMDVIRERRSDAVFLQSDACERFSPSDPADPRSVRAAAFLQERSWLAFDLTYGRPISTAMRAWLGRSGMTAARLAWFEASGTDAGCIVGLDYYEHNEHSVDAHGMVGPTERLGFAALARESYARFQLPFMLAETNNTAERAIPWLTEVWNDTVDLLADGFPVRGFCWYSLTDQIDWDTCMREANGRVNSFGLLDLDRRERPVARVYTEIARLLRSQGPVALPADDDLAA